MNLDPSSLWVTVGTALEVLWVLGMGIYIVLERRSPQATLAWVLGLAFLPVVGLLVYLVLGPRRYERRKRRRARARSVVQGETSVDIGAEHDQADEAVHLMRLCESAAGLSARPRHSHAELYLDGRSKFAALIEAIDGAKKYVHAEYYIYEPDTIGTRVRDALTAAAKRGVEVKLLIDDFGSAKATARFFRPLTEAGARVERFNALSLSRWRPRMANFRTHRKIVVVDGTIGLVGGMNISDAHSDEVVGKDAWRDTHLRLRGFGVKGLQMVFFEDWQYATDEKLRAADYLPDRHSVPPGGHVVQVVSSGPDENLDAIHKLYFASMAAAHQRVLLTTPYFVPDDAILSALTTAALRGADVRVLVPAAGDVPLVAYAARTYYPELLQAGVRIWEYGPPVLHAKTLVVDRTVSVIGTANCDNRSFRLNFEVVVATYDDEMSDALATAFEKDLERASEVHLRELRALPFHERLFASTARLLSPIL